MESQYHASSGGDACRLPADSYHELLQVRDQLLLHARCIAPITRQEDDAPLELTRNMLADCFQQLAKRLAQALDIDDDAEPDNYRPARACAQQERDARRVLRRASCHYGPGNDAD